MPLLDFMEIPEAHLATGNQDSFELFARDFLVFMGFEIQEGPDRGVDAGRDMIAIERRAGIAGETVVRWLVSCKHKAHSGASVVIGDEPDIKDRLEAHDCSGFIGVYSTLPASSLAGRLAAMNVPSLIYDRGRIESELLDRSDGLKLAARNMPISFANWQAENPHPATIWSDACILPCKVCDKDLLSPTSGIVVLWSKLPGKAGEPEVVTNFYWVCKGKCDSIAKARAAAPNTSDRWEDIPDICIPTIYAKWVMSTYNGLRRGVQYEDEAFDSMKHFMLSAFPHIARDLTTEERTQLGWLQMIPEHLGGMGFD